MLEVFLRKYAWTVKLALLFAAAWIAAKAVNTAVGALVRPVPQTDLAALPAPAARQGTPGLEMDRLYPLIGLRPPAPAAEQEAATGPAPGRTCDDSKAAPVKSSLRLLLVAAVVADRPQWSLATLLDTSSRESRIYVAGDQVAGARLLSVERIRDDRDPSGRGSKVVAIVCNNGSKEFLDFEPGEGATPSPNLGVSPLPPPRGDGGAPGEGVRKLSDSRYEIDRGVIDNSLSNLNAIASQARLVPNFKNGVANGFKLFSIQPNSLYTSIGIENGDVIQKINGYEINSPDKALEVYQKLKESRHITLEIERSGNVIRKEYNVTGP
jgi:general secretion pathway protein C